MRIKVVDFNAKFEEHKELVPMQPDDVDELVKNFGLKPSASLRNGLRKFAQWHQEFYM